MTILGISAFYHDAAAALCIDGKIIAAAQEERFTRIKHDDRFPENAIRFCLEKAGVSSADLDAVVFYDKPWLKFERLLEMHYREAPRGLPLFLHSIPMWLKDKLFMKKQIRKGLKNIGHPLLSDTPLLFPEHHLSHAASAFYPSPFEEAAIVTVDGVGEWATTTIAHGKGDSIKVLKEMHYPHSIGLLYSSFTYFLGFRVNSGEYKVMGLAPYADRQGAAVLHFQKVIESELLTLHDDGVVELNLRYFSFTRGMRMIPEKRWEELFGFARRNPESEIHPLHCALAMSLQLTIEKIVIRLGEEARKLTGSKNLCLAGGVALNCVANQRLEEAGIFDNIFVQPAAGDAGGAVGAALAGEHVFFGKKREITLPDAMMGMFLGPKFQNEDFESNGSDGVSKRFRIPNELHEYVARRLAEGAVVGWMQGRMEFGPRALGSRSILADPRRDEMQEKVNRKIKFRESFRPFAPVVLEEKAAEWFEINGAAPYMTRTVSLRADKLHPVHEGFHDLPMDDQLEFRKSDLPAITHVDGSARIQTVGDTHPLRGLLEKWLEASGCPVLLNTSFNLRGEPIVCTPEDAFRTFEKSEMDLLVIGSFIFERRDQNFTSTTDHD